MPALKDLTGVRFGKLVVSGLHPERTSYGTTRWICNCDCGNEKIIAVGNIGKNTNSCGCIRNTQGSYSHSHPLYKRWTAMLDRCTNERSKDYKRYGERGISVCKRWRHFPSFLEDMENSFFAGATLERKNNDGDYDPENVHWATTAQQARNKRRSVIINTPWGQMNVAEAAERLGMSRERFSKRVKLGWTTTQLFDPKNNKRLTKWDRRRGARNA